MTCIHMPVDAAQIDEIDIAMDLDGEVLGQLESAHCGNRVACEYGEVHVAVRASSPFRLRVVALQGDEFRDGFSEVFDQCRIARICAAFRIGSGILFQSGPVNLRRVVFPTVARVLAKAAQVVC